LYLVESFYTIQGEGKFAGFNSIFFRFGGCNLRCKGFKTEIISPVSGKKIIGCDSIRAVDKEFIGEWIKIESRKQFKNILNSYLKNLNFKPHIVFTGGEPLLFYKDRSFYKFIKYLVKKNFTITIETNSTIYIDFKKFPFYKNVIFAMGVKLSNSNEDVKNRLKPKAIKNLVKNSDGSFFKFVLDRDLIKNQKAKFEISKIVAEFPKTKIYCMPLGDTSKELEKHDKTVVEFCKKNGYIYMDRLHIRLWQNKKGV